MSDYIKIFRDTEWINEPALFYFWVKILLMANGEGELTTTLSELANATMLSIKQAQSYLARLQAENEITCSTDFGGTRIVIREYGNYVGDNEKIIADCVPVKSSIPYPSPFILSSVEKSWAMGDPSKIVQVKRKHLEENLKAISDEIGMDADERNRFLGYYCQPGDRNRSEILAEKSGYFDLRYRAENWMKKASHNKPVSRIEQAVQTTQRFTDLVNRFYGSNVNRAGDSPADSPDEQ